MIDSGGSSATDDSTSMAVTGTESVAAAFDIFFGLGAGVSVASPDCSKPKQRMAYSERTTMRVVIYNNEPTIHKKKVLKYLQSRFLH
jgi:hypothetical protein